MTPLRSASSGGRMQERVSRSGSQTRARSKTVMVRLTPAEHERYAALAAKYGRSLPDTMRLAVEAALLGERWRDDA